MGLMTRERVMLLLRLREPLRLFPPREGAAFWDRGHPRNLAVGCQKLYGSNSIGKSCMDTTNVHSQKPRCIELNSC